MDAIAAGSSTNSRRSLSRAGSRSTRRRILVSSLTRQTCAAGNVFKPASSPEFITGSRDMSLVKDENAPSDYHKALSPLKNNPPEQRLDIPMPYSQYLNLEECWSKTKSARNISEDQKYPYLAYNSCAKHVTVVTAQRTLHEGAALALGDTIISSVRQYLSSHGADASLLNKQADGTTMSSREGAANKVMIAVEVGYSEHYTAVCRDKDMSVSLVCLDELPRFRNPGTLHDHVGDVSAEMDRMAQSFAEKAKNDISQGFYGYIEYRGHKWVGDLNQAFIEVRRANERQPTRYDWEAANLVDGNISFDGDLYVEVIRKSMKTTAEERNMDHIRP
ncbi:hypothetical protein V1519DRAFT_470246 [Lipomyces tetrasporus]